MISYHDPSLSSRQSDFRDRIAADEAEAVLAEVGELRQSHLREDRIGAAVAYAELGQAAQADGDLRAAAEHLHYAAHIFRGLGNQNKAAQLYESSFDAGFAQIDATDAERRFDLRSIRRATLLFREAGRTERRLATLRKSHLGDAALRGGTHAIASRLWDATLGYNLDWAKAWLALLGGVALSVIWPGAFGDALALLGAVAFLVTAIRRLGA